MTDSKATTPDKPVDYKHRNRINIIAAVGIGIFFLICWGVTRLFVDHENLQNCIDSGRKNCIDFGVQPREGVVRPPTRQ